MKNLLILTFIFSSIFLASCGKEIEYKKISDTEIDKRIEIANNYLANFNINSANEYLSDSKTDTNLSGKISAKWDGHTLKTKGFTCENIIPYLEYQINGYNNEIGYFGKYGDFENNPGIYDGYFLEYDGFIKLKFKEKDINDICLYGASFLSNTGGILDNTDETVGIYKEGIFEYIYSFGLEKYNSNGGLPKTKNEIATMGFEYGGDTRQNRILDNNGDKYFNTNLGGSIQLMFNTDITSYLEYLSGISDNFINESTTFNINENGIY